MGQTQTQSHSHSPQAQVGHIAPEFKLQNEKEEWVNLSELVAKGPVMLAFYPGDFTPVCTRQLCTYQEAYDRFVHYGVQVVGISGNTPEEHQRFKQKYGFAFPLLTDPGKTVTKRYGVTSILLLGGASRAVFILAKGGRVLYRYVEPLPLTHRKPKELLQILDELKSRGAI